MLKESRYHRYLLKIADEDEDLLEELSEEGSIFGYQVSPDQRVFVSNTPYDNFYSVWQKPHTQKPAGLWYACGSAWIDWVRINLPDRMSEYKYLYEVVPSDRVYKIDNVQKLIPLQRRFQYNREGLPINLIDWGEVQKAVAGIEICPYPLAPQKIEDPLWGEVELKPPDRYGDDLWYYAWDVPSGVIWDESGIQDIRFLAKSSEE